MLTAILIVLVVLTLAVFRVNQYLRVIAKNQGIVHKEAYAQQQKILRAVSKRD